MRRNENSMFDLKRKVVALAIACLIPACAFAQKGRDRDRPPKPPNTVVVAPKGDRPPPDKNQGPKKPEGDKKGKN
jgi:hypothetical protein